MKTTLLLLIISSSHALRPLTTKINLGGLDCSPKKDILEVIDGPSGDIFVSPSTRKPLYLRTRHNGFIKQQYFTDRESDQKFYVKKLYTDFTISDEVDKPLWSLSPKEATGQKFFQIPLISGIYERGYRQNFENFGFPGIEKEFQEVDDFFLTNNATNTILDLSCGSGFMTRQLSKSNHYNRIIAGDLSPSMLTETYTRLQNDNQTAPYLIRCDAAKLPIASSSLDAVHAGAAMHCWPKVPDVLAEIYRVLRPGGVFYASTILTPAAVPVSKSTFYVFKSEAEIENLLIDAGFSFTSGASISVRTEGSSCLIAKAVKGLI